MSESVSCRAVPTLKDVRVRINGAFGSMVAFDGPLALVSLDEGDDEFPTWFDAELVEIHLVDDDGVVRGRVWE